MKLEEVRVGQRIRVNFPGAGDHGQLGTIKQVRGSDCYIHLDWDEHPQRRVMFDAKYLEPVPDEPVRAGERDR